MARTTESQVTTLLQDDYESGDTVAQYIEAATDLVTEVASNDSGGLLSSTRLELIERYLAAHLYTFQNHQAKSEKNLDAQMEFAGEYGLGLDGSKYGQFVKTLDSTGYLKRRDKGTTVQFTWLGKAPSDQTDYVDRD